MIMVQNPICIPFYFVNYKPRATVGHHEAQLHHLILLKIKVYVINRLFNTTFVYITSGFPEYRLNSCCTVHFVK